MSQHQGFQVDRRTALSLAAGAGAATAMAGLTSTPAAAATSMANGSDGPLISGPLLDLNTPAGARDGYARLVGNTDMESTKYGWYDGLVIGVRDGEPLRTLLGFQGFSCAKLLPHEDGDGYRKVLREVGFYYDLQSGEILEEWENPYTGENVRVVHVANDPFNQNVQSYFRAPPSYGGLNPTEPMPRIPFKIHWEQKKDRLIFDRHIHLFYPAALQPDEWPRESPGSMARVTEMFFFDMAAADMQDASKTSVEYGGTWGRVTPWLPWMLMDQAPGHIVYQTHMGAWDEIEMIPQHILDYAEKMDPKWLEAPKEWVEPSLSSLENYAREQTPAAPPGT